MKLSIENTNLWKNITLFMRKSNGIMDYEQKMAIERLKVYSYRDWLQKLELSTLLERIEGDLIQTF